MAATETKTPDVKVVPEKELAPEARAKAVDYPAAGPHAKPELNDAMKTPGAGMLSDPSPHETDAPGG